MSTPKQILIAIALMIALVIETFIIIDRRPRTVTQITKDVLLQHAYDSLQNKILEKEDSLLCLKTTITSIDNYASAVMEQYKNDKNELTKLQKKSAQKDSAIAKYTVLELDSALANRYR